MLVVIEISYGNDKSNRERRKKNTLSLYQFTVDHVKSGRSTSSTQS